MASIKTHLSCQTRLLLVSGRSHTYDRCHPEACHLSPEAAIKLMDIKSTTTVGRPAIAQNL